MKLRQATPLQEKALELALEYLALAREHLKAADAPKTLARVRAAISSAKGARRHMSTRRWRTTNPEQFDPTAGAGQDMKDAMRMRSYR